MPGVFLDVLCVTELINKWRQHESMCFSQTFVIAICLLFVSVPGDREHNYSCDIPTIQYLATRMALYGKLEDFDINSGDWNEYEDRLAQYFIANDIDDEAAGLIKKRAILLTTMGPQSYSLLRKLCTPNKPSEKTYVELCTLLKEHQNPKPSVIVSRFKFYSRNRKSSETVSQYIAELRKLTEYCEFNDWLEDMLRDRIVCGIADNHMQRRLLSESTLTYKKAVEMCTAMESASRGLRELSLSDPVHRVSQNSGGRKYHSNKQSQSRNAYKPPRRPCFRCGSAHSSETCRFKDTECRFCQKIGHLEKVCMTKQRDQRNSASASFGAAKRFNKFKSPEHNKPNADKFGHNTRYVDHSSNNNMESFNEDTDELTDYPLYSLYHMSSKRDTRIPPYTVSVNMNGVDVTMEIDTGCAKSIISEATYNQLWSHTVSPTLSTVPEVLSTYTNEQIKVKGILDVNVKYGGQEVTLPLRVATGKGPTLLGRDWLEYLTLDWRHIHNVYSTLSHTVDLEFLLQNYSHVFKDELGTFTGPKASLRVDANATPKFFRARSIPFSLRSKVDAELARLQNDGVIQPVKFSDWAAPVVPILKPDGNLRLCGDYKLTVNQVAKLEQYPLPLLEDIFASLTGGQTYSILDLSHAYSQIELEETSKVYTTINTHRGLFRYVRMPYGISSAPALFQRTMETLLQGIPGLCVFLDDIIITGKSKKEHLAHLQEVLHRLSDAGLRLKRQKCTFMAPEVVYLGYKISKVGIAPTEAKLKAVQEAPRPTNVTEMKSFVGLLNYYGRFLPQLSSVLEPLYKLQRKKVRWHWGPEQESAFKKAKSLLQSAKVLVHYDTTQPLVLTCDASPYGVGAVLAHRLPNGDERPIGYVSRTLTSAEKGYSQLEKEGLALIFGVTKFHKFLYGRHFTLISDHRPLSSLFNENKAIPTLASARIQRWALILSAYEYDIHYKPGKDNLADALSRLPLSSEGPTSTEYIPELVHLMEVMSTAVITTTDIKQWTSRDPVLSRVYRYILNGWPENSDEFQDITLRDYYRRRNELSVLAGCILWGSRVIIPSQGRAQLLAELHDGHPGMSRMKGLARSYMWWPGMDKNIEHFVSSCDTCQLQQNAPPSAPIQPWHWPSRPWSRLHIDYAGPFLNKMFLIVIDSYSKWIDAFPVSAATSFVTIDKLRTCFATHGIPQVVVSDNASQFVSAEFQEFLKHNHIKHIRAPAYHPSSNGLAERAVQIFKNGMKSFKSGSIETKLARFLFTYRRLPQSTTGVSPAELLMNRKLRSRIDAIFPDPSSKVVEKQQLMKETSDVHSRIREFTPGQLVYVSTLGKLVPGVVVEKTGSVMYKVTLLDGRIVTRHIDHLRRRSDQVSVYQDIQLNLDTDKSVPNSSVSSANEERPTSDIPEAAGLPDAEELSSQSTVPSPVVPTVSASTASTSTSTTVEPETIPSAEPSRRSTRNRRPVKRLIDEI